MTHLNGRFESSDEKREFVQFYRIFDRNVNTSLLKFPPIFSKLTYIKIRSFESETVNPFIGSQKRETSSSYR